MKTPILEGDFAPARSYGLIESVGRGRTDCDQSDGDDAYFELCLECRPVQPDGLSRLGRGRGDTRKSKTEGRI